MKKTFIKIFFIGLALSCVAFLSIQSYRRIEIKRIATEKSMRLPRFSFNNLDGSLLTIDSSFYNNDKVVINYFNPDCEHCQYMATQIKKRIADFEDIKLLMITSADSLPVAEFAKKYGLENTPSVTLLRDPKYMFDKLFGSSVVPSFFLYKNGALINKITGETKVDNVIAF